MNSLWHRQCFKCKGCDEPVVDGRDYVAALDTSGRPWPLCLDCHFEEKDLRCAKCNQILRESYIEFNGMNMHRSCFVCAECNKPFLNGHHVVQEGKPTCSLCIVKIPMDDEELDEGGEELDESGKEPDEDDEELDEGSEEPNEMSTYEEVAITFV